MSRTIDERVVSMQFDNKHFETNVRTTMSTLDKLKQSLNLSGASKSLENVGAAAKSVNFNPLASGVEAVSAKFSALEVMGITALANITNSAINAGKRIVSALTIDPVKTGFSEYELKMSSVQTIMASTGESLDTVNKYLEELNLYSDQTIYSFSDMTQNIGKFTNAGVKLPDAVAAIKGIANAAALSGANANEASRSMYNFAQALSAGYVKLIDWKSIELANMATVEFKQQLIDTAVEVGTLTKTTDGMYETLSGTVISATKNFNESLADQWMTTDVLTTTLGNYADETTEIGERATEAATKVKTFTMMMDTLKESAQSGWAKTWELIFGDFDQGTKLWTTLATTIGGIIEKVSNARNNLLEAVLGGSGGSQWDKWIDKVNKAGITTTAFKDKIKEVAKEHGISLDEMIEKYGSFEKALANIDNAKDIVVTALKRLIGFSDENGEAFNDMSGALEKYQEVVNKVIKGDFGDGEERIKALTEAGWNQAAVQEIVNRVWERNGQTWEDCTITSEDLRAAFDKMTDAELENLGYTKEQIDTIRKLSKEMDEMSVEEFMEALYKPTGRELILESFANTWEAVKQVFGEIKNAWVEIFPPKELDQRAEGIYGVLEAIHAFTVGLRELMENEETLEDLKNTFKGLFAILDIIRTFAGGALGIAFKVLNAVLAAFDMNILGLTGSIGEAIVAFRDWLLEGGILTNIINGIADAIVFCINKIREWFDAFVQLPFVQKTIDWFAARLEDISNIDFGAAAEKIKGWFNAFKELPAISAIIGWFADRLEDIKNIDFKDAGKKIKEWFNAFKELPIISNIIGWFADKLEDISNSKIFRSLKDLPVWIADMVSMFKQVGFTKTLEVIKADLKTAGRDITRYFSQFKVVQAVAKVLRQAFKAIVEGIKEFRDNLSGIKTAGSNVIDGFKNGLKEGLVSIPKLIVEIGKTLINSIKAVLGIHSPSTVMFAIGGFVIAGLIAGMLSGASEMWPEIDGIGEGLANAFRRIGDYILSVTGSENFGELLSKAFSGLMSILLITTLRKFANALDSLAFSLAEFVEGVTSVMKATAFKAKMEGFKDLMVGMAVLLGTITAMVLLFNMFDISQAEMWNVLALMASMVAVLAGMSWVLSKLSGNALEVSKQGVTLKSIAPKIIAIGIAVLLMSAAVKLLGTMIDGEDASKMWTAILGLAAIMGALGVLIGAIALLGKMDNAGEAVKVGKTLRSIAVTMLLMLLVAKLASKLKPEEIKAGAIFVGAMLGFVLLLTAISAIPGNKIDKIGQSLLKISASMILMIAVCKLASTLDKDDALKGAAFTVAFLVFTAALIGLSYLLRSNIKSQDAFAKFVMKMSISLALMAGVMALIGLLSWSSLGKAGAFIAAFGVLVAALVGVTKWAGAKQINSLTKLVTALGKTIMSIAIAVGILAGVTILLGILDPKLLGQGIAFVAGLVILFGSLIWVTKYAKKCVGNLVTLTVAIGVLAAVVIALSFIKADKIWPAVGAMAALMVLFGGLIFITKYAKTTKGAVNTLALLVLVVGILGAVMVLLGNLPHEQTITAAVAMVAVMAALAGLIIIISKFKVTSTAVKNVAILALVVGAVGALMLLVAKISSNENWFTSLTVVAVMVSLVAALAGLMWAMGKFKVTKAMVTNTVTLAAVIGGLGAVLLLISKIPAKESLYAAGSLVLVMAALVGALWLISKVKIDPSSTTTIAIVGATIAVLSGVLYLLSLIPAEKALLSAAAIGVIMLALATSLLIISKTGTVSTGALVGIVAIAAFMGVMALVISQLTSLPMESALVSVGLLSALMLVLSACILILSTIGTASAAGLLAASVAIIAIAGALVILTPSLVALSQLSLQEIGKGLLALAGALAVMLIAGAVATAIVPGLAVLAVALLALGLTALMLAEALDIAVQAMVALSNIDADGLTAGAEAMAAAITIIVTSIVSLFPLIATKIGEGIIAICEVIIASTETIVQTFVAIITSICTGIIETAPVLVETFVTIVSSILTAIQTLGPQIVETFVAIFSSILTGIQTLAPQIGQTFVTIMDTIVNTLVTVVPMVVDGFLQMLAGILQALADNTPAIVQAGYDIIMAFLTGIKNNIGDIITTFVDIIVEILNAIGENIPKMMQAGVDLILSFINGLSDTIENNAEPVREAVFRLIGVIFDAITGNFTAMVGKGSELIGQLMDGMGAEGDSLGAKALSLVSSAIETIGFTILAWYKKGTEFVSNIGSGIWSGLTSLGQTALSVINGALEKAKEALSSWWTFGVNLVQGFIDGVKSLSIWDNIKDGFNDVKNKVIDLFDFGSPSRLFRQYGEWLDLGFIEGIESYGSKMSEVTVGYGKEAIDGFSSAIAKVSDLVNSDMESHPTIRPVLDLSEVTAGANQMNSLFSTNPSVGVLSNVGTISSMMNRSQNGKNGDVISAIDKLSSKLDSRPGDTYQINGVTYDDGTNVSEAVGALTRAIRLERRR